MCMGCNVIGCSDGIVNLLVNGPPVFTKSLLRPLGSRIEIFCSGIGYPLPTVSYYVNNHEVNERSLPAGYTLHDGQLSIEETLNNNTAYKCKLKNIYGSVEKILTMPSAPSSPRNITIIDVTSISVSLNWTEPLIGGDSVISYDVQYRATPVIQSWSSTVAWITTVTVNKLHPYTLYSFRVRAFNGIGYGLYSTSNRVMTLPAAPSKPRNLTFELKGFSDVLVSWEAPVKSNGNTADVMYEVSYYPLNNAEAMISVQSESLQVTLLGLNTSAMYSVSVRAGNSHLDVWSPYLTETVDLTLLVAATTQLVAVTTQSEVISKGIKDDHLIAILCSVGFMVFVVAAILIYFCCRRRNRWHKMKMEDAKMKNYDRNHIPIIGGRPSKDPILLSTQRLLKQTISLPPIKRQSVQTDYELGEITRHNDSMHISNPQMNAVVMGSGSGLTHLNDLNTFKPCLPERDMKSVEDTGQDEKNELTNFESNFNSVSENDAMFDHIDAGNASGDEDEGFSSEKIQNRCDVHSEREMYSKRISLNNEIRKSKEAFMF
ncbi:cell adhesion molecule Dscam1-like [Tubulanus polymorphus]|uniref:cell adhesion molecule Dscam1-like n=1 Tax=Tubulanus polymorphus TaxID=672921 RepID=UPI003DA609E4